MTFVLVSIRVADPADSCTAILTRETSWSTPPRVCILPYPHIKGRFISDGIPYRSTLSGCVICDSLSVTRCMHADGIESPVFYPLLSLIAFALCDDVVSTDGRARLIVIDHGMYRRLHPEFRRSYCKLWKALVVRDTQLLQEAATELGVGRFANVLPLAFTFRSINSNAKLGGRMTKVGTWALLPAWREAC